MHLQLLFNGLLFLAIGSSSAILVASAPPESKTDISPLQGNMSDNCRDGYLWGDRYFITPNITCRYPDILGRMFSVAVKIDYM